MNVKHIKPIVEDWSESNFTFVDEVALAELIGRLQKEEVGYRLCPHNEKRIDCRHCDHREDIAYDAAREGRRG